MLRQIVLLLISKMAVVLSPPKSNKFFQLDARNSKRSIAALDYSTADKFSNHLHAQVFSGASLARELNSLPKWVFLGKELCFDRKESRVGQTE